MGTYRDLDAWKEARVLCKMVYEISALLPESEKFGLSSQMQRAAVSILSNIAEGYGRDGSKEYIRFLHISCGSAYELETQIIICSDLGYFNRDDASLLFKKNTVVIKLLRGLIRSLSQRQGVSIREQANKYGSESGLPFKQPTTSNKHHDVDKFVTH